MNWTNDWADSIDEDDPEFYEHLIHLASFDEEDYKTDYGADDHNSLEFDEAEDADERRERTFVTRGHASVFAKYVERHGATETAITQQTDGTFSVAYTIKETFDHDPPNHGRPWRRDDIKQLVRQYLTWVSIKDIAKALGRIDTAVLSKLAQLRLLYSDRGTCDQELSTQQSELFRYLVMEERIRLELVTPQDALSNSHDGYWDDLEQVIRSILIACRNENSTYTEEYLRNACIFAIGSGFPKQGLKLAYQIGDVHLGAIAYSKLPKHNGPVSHFETRTMERAVHKCRADVQRALNVRINISRSRRVNRYPGVGSRYRNLPQSWQWLSFLEPIERCSNDVQAVFHALNDDSRCLAGLAISGCSSAAWFYMENEQYGGDVFDATLAERLRPYADTFSPSLPWCESVLRDIGESCLSFRRQPV